LGITRRIAAALRASAHPRAALTNVGTRIDLQAEHPAVTFRLERSA
jgi:hypothetical protein